jgi:hypothetical protein
MTGGLTDKNKFLVDPDGGPHGFILLNNGLASDDAPDKDYYEDENDYYDDFQEWLNEQSNLGIRYGFTRFLLEPDYVDIHGQRAGLTPDRVESILKKLKRPLKTQQIIVDSAEDPLAKFEGTLAEYMLHYDKAEKIRRLGGQLKTRF